MRMRNIILTVVAVIVAAACTKQSLMNTYNKQETNIDKYIANVTKTDTTIRVVHSNGSHRVVIVEGDGEELTSRGSVAFYYAGYTFTSSVSASNLFATNSEEVAESSKWNTADTTYAVKVVNMAEDSLVEGLYNGLIGVKEGEECMILFSGEHGFGKKALGTIPANSALAYHVWVESINND